MGSRNGSVFQRICLNPDCKAKEYGEIKMLVNGGVSPSSGSVEAIFKR